MVLRISFNIIRIWIWCRWLIVANRMASSRPWGNLRLCLMVLLFSTWNPYLITLACSRWCFAAFVVIRRTQCLARTVPIGRWCSRIWSFKPTFFERCLWWPLFDNFFNSSNTEKALLLDSWIWHYLRLLDWICDILLWGLFVSFYRFHII